MQAARHDHFWGQIFLFSGVITSVVGPSPQASQICTNILRRPPLRLEHMSNNRVGILCDALTGKGLWEPMDRASSHHILLIVGA
ncbi:uncharacterized protein GGS25DRAFT_483522 [Hypoxylon fragiforme]|uniref:uncharacterized protein n=1 Tax=Hypoxylon fragiforme TaxID=63214 RepID=UPI0020C66525|nr:uncharacterized protein GGS25DRAFT_483522 [Hypoxylon fragiforme]KAI2611641.1 hypothetical protein GGS25DRAFT_483522 [Hypoxylon fragiforme]